MVEPLSAGEIVRVAIGGARQGSACTQRRQPVLGAKGIEIERDGRRRKEETGKRSEGAPKKTVTVPHGCTPDGKSRTVPLAADEKIHFDQ